MTCLLCNRSGSCVGRCTPDKCFIFAVKVLDCELLDCRIAAQSHKLFFGEPYTSGAVGQWRAGEARLVEAITVHHRGAWSGFELETGL